MALTPQTSDSSTSLVSRCYVQEPIAIVGMACRLPGQNDSPHRLWEFLMKGGVADTEAPESRFNRRGHYDGSDRARTSRSSGAMFMETVDPAAFDAKFFNITPQDAISMDPQQRILLEVVYEALENAGISLESISGQKYGCYVGAHPGDYWDIFARDPDARPPNVGIGCSGTMLSCRVSHFLNIKGPSMPIDTACSSSLVAMDVACRALHTGEINGAIVAASSLILNPEYACEGGTIRFTHSPTARCHVFDAKADGYVRAEGMNTVILKRLDDALQDGDPIRAVIRGIANNHNGRTPGIASPSGEDQAAAVRQAYANANITDFSQIGYLECHGTGTLVGDPIETEGASTVFAPFRPDARPLRIGSVKSNIGHSEPAAGLSGVIKAVMVLETGKIPGNPTFLTPNPNIDFKKLKLEVSQHVTDFPDMPFRRVGVNCFGFGGSNAHAILDEPRAVVQNYTPTYTSSFQGAPASKAEPTNSRPYLLCFSANEESSLRRYIQNVTQHVEEEKVHIALRDLAHTLGTRRSHLFNRAYMVANSLSFSQPAVVTFGKKNIRPPQVGFVFTGQGSQWPEMGRELLQTFEPAREMILNLDSVLQCLVDPPKWTLFDELTAAREPEHVRKPEFSQPLVTALQLALIVVLRGWGIAPNAVVGHSSGEIAAAYAAGYLTSAEAIIIAYHRGKASANEKPHDEALGMLAVGIGANEIDPFMEGTENVQIACYNGPKSLTLSGSKAGLEEVQTRLVEAGVFARMLQVDMAYHSAYMENIGITYEKLLARDLPPTFHRTRTLDAVSMFSSVSGSKQERPPDVNYWKTNMTRPVRFDEAVRCMLTEESPIDKLIEIGPSGTLKGPIAQIMASMGAKATGTAYLSSLRRGQDSIRSTLEVAGELYLSGLPVDMAQVNEDAQSPAPRIIIDLPNYCWNHSTKYWNESTASRDWRFKKFVHHDLIGSKVLGTPWRAPVFKKSMALCNLPWLKDHRIGSNTVFPGSGYLAMAVEGIYQVQSMNGLSSANTASELCYHLRNVRFEMALTLEEGIEPDVYLSLNPLPGSKDVWYEFSVSSSHAGGATIKHAGGQIRVQDPVLDAASATDIAPLVNPTPGDLWTKAFAEMGFEYGPAFYLLEKVEAHAGKRYSRSLVSLSEPLANGKTQSHYPYHPAALDGIFRATAPAFCEGLRTRLKEPLVPSAFDDLIINPNPNRPTSGMAIATSVYSGRGREDTGKSFWSDVSMYDPDTGALLMQLKNFSTHLIDLGVCATKSQWLTQDVWKPDVATLTVEAMSKLKVQQKALVSYVLDLMTHKNPALAILEINLGTGAETSTWFERESTAVTDSYRKYCCLGDNLEALDLFQARYQDRKNTSFCPYNREASALGLESGDNTFDIIIINPSTDQVIAPVLTAVKSLLTANGRILLTALSDQDDATGQIAGLGFSHVLPMVGTDGVGYLCSTSSCDEKSVSLKPLHVFYMEPTTCLTQAIRAQLNIAGWDAYEHVCNPDNIPESGTVLIIDELFAPVLPHFSDEQWQCLRGLVGRGCKILWVTQGGQMQVTEPDNAMITGLFRSIRSEDPSAVVMTLDVESRDDPSAPNAIVHALSQLSRPQARWTTDMEYVERDGIIYIHRVAPYKRLGEAIKEEADAPIQTRIHDLTSIVQLRAQKLGTLEGLAFCEIPDVTLPDDHVEIEIHAVGLNFKDVAVTMGIVPENEYLLGLEGAGIVRRVGSGLSPGLVGSRMVFIIKGALANRIQVPISYTHEIPDSMSFEEAASMPVVYSTAIYSLFNIGNLQKGQRVLIHSAAGGVGIACIQLAKYAEADIFVTVGTNEKRQYLNETFGIPFDRMFTSRSTTFAAEIMKATNGQGIDVIVNSLTGELLDATWRICADGGTMVEIGKRDIVERNYLSMEPFDRGCSYRAVDLSHAKIMRDGVHFKLIKRLFELIAGGHITPITRITRFSMMQVQDAFAYLRSGKHIGKVVISDGEALGDVEVPVHRLQHNVTITDQSAFLIVGGLKGLCGSLAVRLAYRGVRHIVIMTRSGCRDPRSQAVIAQCRSLGCAVYDCCGDVARIVDVRRAFTRAPYPIQGVIHGAMVLRDRPYETMTVREFHEAVEAKVHGAWNLHSVATEKRLPLDFFLCLSSISSVIGSKGQANYAAANCFLDSFAAYRRSLGAKCLTINLGVIEDVGVVAESDALSQRHQRSVEITAIPESALHAILDAALCCQATTEEGGPQIAQIITGLALPQDPEQSMLRFDLRFRTLFVANGAGSSSAGGSGSKTDPLARAVQRFRALFRADPDAETDDQLVQQTCLEILGTRLAQMLRWDDSQQVEPGQPLSVYGLDSLAAVELRNWIKAEMGANVSTLDIVNADSLVMLGGRVVSKLRAEQDKERG
ncbi:polyketide synthase fmaB [Aspergillus saccharolyticus JOP 1030-1]|uniref:Polyketide synthase module n=1 Tax=Aspergillus saccharolyticus JOP 1030-1 TaxID=1450539 RepID=A0A318Z9Y6_9EURO|nr:polyketide synthase module [Aspergillus saccharolyticus JOP 1030-1]PYH44059.1 polyketide synthase module [Aspergillus saccharolyticus JOP 1030-1]